jgi:crotonobetainyl-CoA:carnitine CoA-transferase CaiB-like acyl-CoA transferase
MIGAFWDFGDVPTVLDSAPPSLGQHSTEVLLGLGYSEGEVAALVDAGVVVQGVGLPGTLG